MSATYAYDNNGNMTTDGRKYLVITYNAPNLQQSLSQNGTTVVSYTWLADGTKCAVVDNTTHGYDYIGSLIYSRSGSVRTLESAAFGGGRFVNTNNTILPYYYITDHNGSTRVITNNNGTLNGKDSKSADVTVYGINGNDPRESLPYRLSVNGNTELDGTRNGQPIKMNGVFFHRIDNDGNAGMISNIRWRSEGCPVVNGANWRDIKKSLGTNIIIKVGILENEYVKIYFFSIVVNYNKFILSIKKLCRSLWSMAKR